MNVDYLINLIYFILTAIITNLKNIILL